MDCDNIEELLNRLNLQNNDADSLSDFSTDLFTESSTEPTPDNEHTPKRLRQMLKELKTQIS
jgi:hypothetical protein